MVMHLCIFGRKYSSFLVALPKDVVVRQSVLVLIWGRLVVCGADKLSARRSSGTSCQDHHSARARAKKPFLVSHCVSSACSGDRDVPITLASYLLRGPREERKVHPNTRLAALRRFKGFEFLPNQPYRHKTVVCRVCDDAGG
jgi:hypothetical protein